MRTLNINHAGLRLLQRREAMAGLIKAAAAERDAVLKASGKRTLPLLVKIAPDLDEQQKRDIADIALSTAVDGLIVSNTTISRPASLQSEHKTETGGLSGLPVRDLATATVADMYRLTQGRVPIVGVGGVQSGQDAYDKIRAGASLVQVYSMMVYAGPDMVQSLKKELAALLQRDGYSSVSEAVGAAHRESKQ
jgi:dihydroorotate dehydrogenase